MPPGGNDLFYHSGLKSAILILNKTHCEWPRNMREYDDREHLSPRFRRGAVPRPRGSRLIDLEYMAMKKILPLLFTALLLLGGCSGILNRDYIVMSPHHEQKTEEESTDELQATNYAGLKSAILHVIETGAETGTVKLYNYTGDVERDLLSACSEVTNDDALGAYAVGSMSYQQVRVLTYYEVTINITYRRTPDQISSVKNLVNIGEFKDACGRPSAISTPSSSRSCPITTIPPSTSALFSMRSIFPTRSTFPRFPRPC